MEFKGYEYNPELLWNTLDAARIQLGIRKNELSNTIGRMESFYAAYMFKKPDMKLTTAFKLASAVGLTLDEALRGESNGVFFKYLDAKGLEINDLPKDSILRSFPFKSLIPTFHSASELCFDHNIGELVSHCLTADIHHLSMLFLMSSPNNEISRVYDWMGYEPKDFDELRYDYDTLPNILQQFWSGGVHYQFGRTIGFDKLTKATGKEMREFAEKLGISVTQLYRYLHGMEDDTTKIVAEPKLSRIVEICNVLGVNFDDMVEPIYSFNRWTGGYIDAFRDPDNEFSLWHSRFYVAFRNTFKALPILQAIIDNYRLMEYLPNKEEKRDQMLEMARRI